MSASQIIDDYDQSNLQKKSFVFSKKKKKMKKKMKNLKNEQNEEKNLNEI
jgi:hypothetical protein